MAARLRKGDEPQAMDPDVRRQLHRKYYQVVTSTTGIANTCMGSHHTVRVCFVILRVVNKFIIVFVEVIGRFLHDQLDSSLVLPVLIAYFRCRRGGGRTRWSGTKSYSSSCSLAPAVGCWLLLDSRAFCPRSNRQSSKWRTEKCTR